MTPKPASRPVTAVTRRAACALTLATAALALLELSADLQQLFDPLGMALARMTETTLGRMDIPVQRQGTLLAHPEGFSYRITYVCSGARPAVLLLAAVLAVPAPWRWRIAGLAASFAVLETLNVIRLSHLYWTGFAHPESFVFAHRVAWNAVFVVAVVGLLALWLALAARGFRRASTTTPRLEAHV